MFPSRPTRVIIYVELGASSLDSLMPPGAYADGIQVFAYDTAQIFTRTVSSDGSTPIWFESTGGGGGGGSPTGAAGGDLTGTYPNPSIANLAVTAAKIASGTITDTQVAAANKDGTAGTLSLRTLGTGAQQAMAGNDARVTGALQANGSVAMTANLPAGGFRITGLADPSSAQDSATKAYVDALAQGLDVKQSVRYATTTNLVATRSVNTLTATANGSINNVLIDGANNWQVGERLLVKNQTTAADNGIYRITAIGDNFTPYAMVRDTDADTSAKVTAGMYVVVNEGTAQADSSWVLTTNDNITLNTTALSFSLFTSAGSNVYVKRDGTATLTGTWDVGGQAINGLTALRWLNSVNVNIWSRDGSNASVYGDGNGAASAGSLFLGSNIRFGPDASTGTAGSNAWQYFDSNGNVTFRTGTTGAMTARLRIDHTNGNVTVGSATAGSDKAALAIESTTKGFLPPRHTTTQRDAVTTPPVGLVVYNTTTDQPEFYKSVGGWTGVGDVTTGTAQTIVGTKTFTSTSGLYVYYGSQHMRPNSASTWIDAGGLLGTLAVNTAGSEVGGLALHAYSSGQLRARAITYGDGSFFIGNDANLATRPLSGGANLGLQNGASVIFRNNANTAEITALQLTSGDVLQLRGHTVPSTSADTVALLTATQTFTNKTLTSPTINVGSDATGDIFYRSSGGGLARLAPGTSGYLLQTNGAGNAPSWVVAPSGGGGGVPTSRLISSGTGLTGGGDLTADRTLSVVYGTSASTALEGTNDALYVKLAGSQNISGAKTFQAGLVVSAAQILDAPRIRVASATAISADGFYIANNVGIYSYDNVANLRRMLYIDSTANVVTLGNTSSPGVVLEASTLIGLAVGGLTRFQATGTTLNASLPIAMATNKITGLGDPTAAQDAATKAYVDTVVSGLDVKPSVRAATTANITLSGTQTIDGVACIAGNRVLVKNQTTGSQNGIYVVAAGAWTRATDADSSSEVTSGMFTFVSEGTTLGGSGWVLTTADPITLGTTSLAFSQFNGSGGGGGVPTGRILTAGDGLTGGGDLSADRTFAVGPGYGITVDADSVNVDTTASLLWTGEQSFNGGIITNSIEHISGGAGQMVIGTTAAQGGDAGNGIDLVIGGGSLRVRGNGTTNDAILDTSGTVYARQSMVIGTTSVAPSTTGLSLTQSAGGINVRNSGNTAWLSVFQFSGADLFMSVPGTSGAAYLTSNGGLTLQTTDPLTYLSVTRDAGIVLSTEDAGTANVVDTLSISRVTSDAGGGAVGFGVGYLATLDNASNSAVSASRITTKWSTATAGAETSTMTFSMRSAGSLVDVAKFDPGGSFFGTSSSLSEYRGGSRVQITSTATNYTCVAGDYIVYVTSTAAARTITLPAVSNGRVIIVKDTSGAAGTNKITVQPPSGTIEGLSGIDIQINYGSRGFWSDGINWFTL